MKNKIFWEKILATIIFPILLFTLIIIFLFMYYNKFTCNGYSCLVFPDKELWKTIDNYKDDKYLWRGLISHPNYLIRLYKLGNIKENNAVEFTKITTMKIVGLFDTAQSPYPGEISDKIICSDKFKPKEEEIVSKTGINIHFITSYLNNRLQYGICLENQLVYRVYSGMFYCSNTLEWYQIEIITPLTFATYDNEYKELFNKVDCQRPSVNTGRLFP